MERARLGAARFEGTAKGHYESWFQRANHPTDPLAFWIRYTVFVPADRERPALGELWAVLFDDNEITARKAELPLEECTTSRSTLAVQIGDATLDLDRCVGAIEDVSWSLRYDSPCPPMLMLPDRLYQGGFPKAKLLVGSPLARYQGSLKVGEREIDIDGWVGSQNHNWGSRHTDRYAWGQVAGFDDAPDVFFEATSAQLRLGPLWTPPLTIASVRIGARTVQRVGMLQAIRANAKIDGYRWEFSSRGSNSAIEATFEATPEDFVALRYLNPPRGHKICLNSKLASCRLRVEMSGADPLEAQTEHRAAFELLRDDHPADLSPLF